MPTKREPLKKPAPRKKTRRRKSPVLTAETQKVMQRLRRCVGYPVIAYWTSSGGSICQNDVMAMSHMLERDRVGQVVGLFLKSDGGNPEAALRLVHLLRAHFRKIVLFAPFECASAATMVALGANEIHMGSTSYLTAVDTSLKHDLSPVDHRNYLVSVSQDEVSRILRLWREERSGQNPYPEVYKYLHPLVIGALDRSSSLSIRICRELLAYHLKSLQKATRISKELNSAYPSHSYPITATEASRLGLNIRALDGRVEELLRELNGLYSRMAQVITDDYDEMNYHNQEICNILEREDRQVYFQVDKDWHYRKEERRWVTLNDKSSWRVAERIKGRWSNKQFFIT